MSSIIPLFASIVDGKEKKVVPKVELNGQAVKTSQMIHDLAEAIEVECKSMASGKEGGQVTIASYLLMEVLLRLGLSQQVEMLQKTPEILQQASLFCAFGILAGRQIPNGVVIETEYTDSDSSLRNPSSNPDTRED